MHPPAERAYTISAAALLRKKAERKCSWKAIARACGVDQGTVKRWAKGGGIFADNLNKLATFLGCTVAALIGDPPEEGAEELPVAPVMTPRADDSRVVRMFNVEGPAEAFTADRINAIIALFKQFAEGDPETIKVMNIVIRSLLITLEMTPEQARRLEEAVATGKLEREGLDVRDATEILKPRPAILEELTPRQREVCRLTAQGKSPKEIAQLLGLSVKTVRWYKVQVLEALRIRDVEELTRFAIEVGLIDQAP